MFDGLPLTVLHELQLAQQHGLQLFRTTELLRERQHVVPAIGQLGELHPALARDLGFPVAPQLFELNLNSLLQAFVPQANDISKQPNVRRDLSVTLPLATPFGRVRDRVTVAAGPLLREILAFDVYQGPGIETGRKSIALGLIFQDNNRTLKDEEADALMARIAADLQSNLDAKLRD